MGEITISGGWAILFYIVFMVWGAVLFAVMLAGALWVFNQVALRTIYQHLKYLDAYPLYWRFLMRHYRKKNKAKYVSFSSTRSTNDR